MSGQWWNEPDASLAGCLLANLSAIKTAQNPRIFNGLRYDSIFDGVDYLGSSVSFSGNSGRPKMPPISYNAVRIVGDILLSKLVQSETKVTFLTDGGKWDERKRAELLDRFVYGEFYRMEVYPKATIARQNAIKQGNGYLKFGNEDGKVTCDVIHPLELWVDDNECFAGPPRQMYHERAISKEVALGLWGTDPEKRAMIERCKVATDNTYHWHSQTAGEMIQVVEGWHLASGKPRDADEERSGHDGLHVIVCEGGVLSSEPWERQTFPFAVFRLFQRSRGFYAIGLVERQLELQLTLNKLIRRKHACIHILSAPYMLIAAGSKVVKSQFNTDIGNEITYLGTKPELIVNRVVPGDIDAAIPQIISWMFQDAGINELEASGQKPQGLDSAPAIESYSDTSGIRHVPILKANEKFFMDVAECILEEVRDVAQANGGTYETFGHFKNHAEIMDWAHIDLKKEAYVMKMAPVNTLPETPAGKINSVIRLAGAGILSPTAGVRALASPDIDAITADVTAPDEDIEWTIYEMTKEENARYLAPEPFQDLQQGIVKVTNALLRERMNKAPNAVLQRLLQWLTDADIMMADQQAAMQAEQQPQPQAPPPQPLGQTTQSPLSNVPQSA